MPETPSVQHLLLRVALVGVSPLVARLLSVSDDLTLDELHEVLQLVFGWSRRSYYRFRIHGQEIGTLARCARAYCVSFDCVGARSSSTPTTCSISGSGSSGSSIFSRKRAQKQPRAASGVAMPCRRKGVEDPAATCGSSIGIKYCPPVVEQALVEQAIERMAKALPAQNSRELLRDLISQGLERAVRRLEDYARFEPEHFSLKEAKERLSRFCPYGRTRP